MRSREPASFWRENVIAVVILLRVLARMSVVVETRSFIVFLSGESLTSFSINNRTNFLVKKKVNEAFRGVFLRTRAKTLS